MFRLKQQYPDSQLYGIFIMVQAQFMSIYRRKKTRPKINLFQYQIENNNRWRRRRAHQSIVKVGRDEDDKFEGMRRGVGK